VRCLSDCKLRNVYRQVSEGFSLDESVALNALFVEKAGENFPLGFLAFDLSPGAFRFPIEPSQPDIIEVDLLR